MSKITNGPDVFITDKPCYCGKSRFSYPYHFNNFNAHVYCTNCGLMFDYFKFFTLWNIIKHDAREEGE